MAFRIAHITSRALHGRVLLPFAVLCAAASMAAADPAGRDVVLHAEQRFQLALEAQTAREYAVMLGELRQAAGEGHAEAQEMLGMVLLTGATLYGPGIRANRCEARRWMLRAASQGSETAKVQLVFLNRLRQSPVGRNACE